MITLKDTYPYITERIAHRVKKRFEEDKKSGKIKTRADIVTESDTDLKVFSSIINNNPNPHKNPYLLTVNTMESIVKNLHFSNPYELIWGTDEEINEYFFQLFDDCLNALHKSDSINSDSILSSYIPYAKDLEEKRKEEETGKDYIFSEMRSDADYMSKLEELNKYLENKYKPSRELAIKYIWQFEKVNFINQHKNFFTKSPNLTTLKLNKKLDDFFKAYFKHLNSFTKREGKYITQLIKQNEYYKEDLNSILTKQEEKEENLLIKEKRFESYHVSTGYHVEKVNQDPSLAGKTEKSHFYKQHELFMWSIYLPPTFNNIKFFNDYIKFAKKIQKIENKYYSKIKTQKKLIKVTEDYINTLNKIQKDSIGLVK